MQSCYSVKVLTLKSDRFSKGQCPYNDIEKYKMKVVLYSSIFSSLMYA